MNRNRSKLVDGVAAAALERMESNISAGLNNDTDSITAVHCLKVRLVLLESSYKLRGWL